MHKFAGGDDTVVVSARAWSGLKRFVLSPDGHSLAFVGSTESDGGANVLDIRSLDGGERKVLRSKVPERLNLQAWTGDGQRLIYERWVPGAPSQLWAVPAMGGEPSDLHFSVPVEPNPISVHPDGVRIAYAEMVSDLELWSRSIPR
jgi:Tol biopolymer transport system component